MLTCLNNLHAISLKSTMCFHGYKSFMKDTLRNNHTQISLISVQWFLIRRIFETKTQRILIAYTTHRDVLYLYCIFVFLQKMKISQFLQILLLVIMALFTGRIHCEWIRHRFGVFGSSFGGKRLHMRQLMLRAG